MPKQYTNQDIRAVFGGMLNGEGPLHGCSVVRVVFNKAVEGVQVPEGLGALPWVALDFSRGYDLERFPIELKDDALYATLFFKDLGDQQVVIPWEAIRCCIYCQDSV